jgi:hypothetical protein
MTEVCRAAPPPARLPFQYPAALWLNPRRYDIGMNKKQKILTLAHAGDFKEW